MHLLGLEFKSGDFFPESRRMNTLKAFFILCGFTLTLSLSLQVEAEVFRWPQACLTGQLQIKNLKNSAARVWLQKFKTSLVSETELNLKPLGLSIYNLKAASNLERFSVLNLGSHDAIEVQFSCNKMIYPAHTFEGGNLTYRKSDLPQSEIWLQNLYAGSNEILLEFQNRRFQTLSTVTLALKPLGKTIYKVPTNLTAWNYLKVNGLQRLAVFNLNSTGAQGPLLVNPQPGKPTSDAKYFVITPRNGQGDFFIARIKDPVMVDRARSLIKNPDLEQILFAKVQKGSQGYNRNWAKSDKSFWSWSVTEVTNFADVGSTSCNGFPQAVEDRVDSWMKSPGQICFWSYRIKKELTLDEVTTGSSTISLPFD